ncbi:MAG: heat-inducible transcription repressor HrcA [Chloroflexi bacterium RBG_13_46_14]|nr:MAG: heat-inducible transcription repressor HrcA [Chloroflexi bacterium RBG_13_46_14]
MLSLRSETILKSIVAQYIVKATPVSSGSLTGDFELNVSSATIRNEMVRLEKDGYITRPHHSSGSVPLDKGYRIYVDTLGDIKLPAAEQRMINHLFHQVEGELDGWLNLAATLLSQLVQNVALVTKPKTNECQLKYLEAVSLQDFLALVIIVFKGAKVRQQLINFESKITQEELKSITGKLNDEFAGLKRSEIIKKTEELSPVEKKITDCLLKEMKSEDSRQYEESYLDGLHYTLNQPELAHNYGQALTLMELVEQRHLVKSITPSEIKVGGVQVLIGKENETESVHDYSVVISQYGLPGEATGTISVVGPTRMQYARTIATVGYLSLILNLLVAKLYGKEIPVEFIPD